MSLYKGTQFIAGTPDMTGYMTTDDLLKALYPVGSIYIGTQSTCPLATLISGSMWVKVSEGRVLQGSDSGHSAGTTIEAGLPNITGTINSSANSVYGNTSTGALKSSTSYSWCVGTERTWQGNYSETLTLNASRSSAIYGNASTVQPPAYVVNIWRRTA
jgi:hypothetical protein